MGYNVVPLRRRLVELSDVVQRRTTHRIEKTRLKSMATRHMMEKNKLEYEIVKLKAKAEAEKASFEDVMDRVAKMEDEMPRKIYVNSVCEA
ncbi:Laminin subunit gamma-1 [Bienertia sinuspersici]